MHTCSSISYFNDLLNNTHFLTDVPDPPASVSLEVVGTKALKVKFSESDSSREPETIVTKYKGKILRAYLQIKFLNAESTEQMVQLFVI